MATWNNKWKDITQGNISKEVGYRHRKRLSFRLIDKYNISGKILDIGCGDGTAFHLFNIRNSQNLFYELDSSDKTLKMAKLNFPNALYYKCSITEKSSLPSEKFDLITCSDVLEEIDDDTLTLQNICDLLSDSGYLLITTQHREKYRTLYDEYAGNIRHYEMADLCEKLETRGVV